MVGLEGPWTDSDTFLTIQGPVNLLKRISHQRWFAHFRLALLWNVSRNILLYLKNGLKNLNHFSNCNVCHFIAGSSEKPTKGHNIKYSESKYLKLSTAVEHMELEYCDLLQHIWWCLYIDCINKCVRERNMLKRIIKDLLWNDAVNCQYHIILKDLEPYLKHLYLDWPSRAKLFLWTVLILCFL